MTLQELSKKYNIPTVDDFAGNPNTLLFELVDGGRRIPVSLPPDGLPSESVPGSVSGCCQDFVYIQHARVLMNWDHHIKVIEILTT